MWPHNLFNGICCHFHICVDMRMVYGIRYLFNELYFHFNIFASHKNSHVAHVSNCINRPGDLDLDL